MGLNQLYIAFIYIYKYIKINKKQQTPKTGRDELMQVPMLYIWQESEQAED